jgi:hypothetical protein
MRCVPFVVPAFFLLAPAAQSVSADRRDPL